MGQKIYDLGKTYNLLLRGSMVDNRTGKEYYPYSVFADWPMQVNIESKNCQYMDLNYVSRDDVDSDDEVKKTRYSTDLQAIEPCVLICISKKKAARIEAMQGIQKIVTEFHESLKKDSVNILEGPNKRLSLWRQVVISVREDIMFDGEESQL